MYRLQVIDPDNVSAGYQDLDLGSAKPTMNYQVSNFNELKDRNASYSQSISLPKSPNNIKILKFVTNFNTFASPVYEKAWPCLLTYDGAQLSPYGAVLRVIEVGDTISVQIVSAVADLFSQLDQVIDRLNNPISFTSYIYSRNTLIADTDSNGNPIDTAAKIKHMWPWTNPFAGLYERPKLPWYTNFIASLTTPPGIAFPAIGMESIIPAVHFQSAIKTILAEFGYDLDLQVSNPIDDYLACTKMLTTSQNISLKYFGSRSINIPAHTGTANYGPTSMDDPYNLGTVNVPTNGGFYSYYAPNNGTYVIDIVIRAITGTALTSGLSFTVKTAVNNGIATSAFKTLVDKQALNFTATNTSTVAVQYRVEDIHAGDIIQVQIEDAPRSTARSLGIDFGIFYIKEDEEILQAIGRAGDYIQDTGFNTYSDLVKCFIQTYGLMVDVSTIPITSGNIGTVTLWSFNKLYQNIAENNILDWSDKLIYDKSNSFTFDLGNYAQKNIVKMKDNTQDNVVDNFTITVNNYGLTLAKDLYEIAIEAGADLPVQSGTGAVPRIANIPIFEIETYSIASMENIGFKVKGGTTHLLKLSGGRFNIGIVQGNNWGATLSASNWVMPNSLYKLPEARHRTMAELKNLHFNSLQQLLTYAKKIKMKFWLTSFDIEQLDFKIPIYIDQLGAYFYIAKINNYIAGQATVVEMIKL